MRCRVVGAGESERRVGFRRRRRVSVGSFTAPDAPRREKQLVRGKRRVVGGALWAISVIFL